MTHDKQPPRKAGLQKSVSEILEGVQMPAWDANDAADGSEMAAIAADAGPENPVVSAVRRQDTVDSPRPTTGSLYLSRPTVMLSVVAIISMLVAIHYLLTHEPPPPILTVALFVLYLVGLTAGILNGMRGRRSESAARRGSLT